MEQDMTAVWVGNLGEAAALVTLGHTVNGMRVKPHNPYNRRQTQFGFPVNNELNGQIDGYLKGSLTVNAQQFYIAVNNLRKQRFDFEATLPQEDDNLNNLRN